MIEWRDTTNYRHGERAAGAGPRTWTRGYGPSAITITKGHIHYPGRWIMHCNALNIRDYDVIGPDTLPTETAQEIACRIARGVLHNLVAEFDLG